MTAPESLPATVLEVAVLDVRAGQADRFEAAMARALPLIRRQPGCRDVTVRPCLENPSRYLLLAHWDTLADHMTGFRTSADYQQWKALLHGFYDPFPVVEHYGQPLAAAAAD